MNEKKKISKNAAAMLILMLMLRSDKPEANNADSQ